MNTEWKWLLAFRRRRRAWRACFLDGAGSPTDAGRRALADLRRFCGVGNAVLRSDASGRTDPMATAEAAGRLAVWNHIARHLHLDDAFIQSLAKESDSDE